MSDKVKHRINFYDAGGYRCAVRVWEATQPIADVIFIHGIISHSGWYGASCQYLAEQGINVHALDRRGSGLNFEQRGHVDDWQTWIDDVMIYIDQLSRDLPKLMLGVSWGGKFAVAFAKKNPNAIQALGLVCPGIYSQKLPGPLKRAALSLASTTGLDKKRVTIPLRDPALFTNTPHHRDYVRDDVLTLRKVTIRFALEDRRLTVYARNTASDLSIPTMMMLASGDRVVDNPKLRAFYESIAAEEKQLIEYQDVGHTLEFEPDPSRYLDDLSHWATNAARHHGGN